MEKSKLRVSIKSVLNSVLNEIKIAVQQVYIKRGKLKKNSDLVQSVEVVNKRNVINVFANFYVDFVDSGRKKFVRKVPISALLYWIKKNRIKPYKGQSLNSLAYSIQNAIYKNGIKARPILEHSEKVTEEIMIKALEEQFSVEIIDDIIRTTKK